MENTETSYNLFAIRPSIDALQEFNVQTGVYSAEYGRAVSQIIVATKSGTNEFHGRFSSSTATKIWTLRNGGSLARRTRSFETSSALPSAAR